MTRQFAFTKGHGTENDFVLIEDPDGEFDLDPAQVRSICDRRAGIGADGVLRIVRGDRVPGWTGDGDIWFMDYRNADGSVAEMCGNGVRVFVRYLVDRGLSTGPLVPVGTRAGLRPAEVLPDGRIRVAMGPARVLGVDARVRTPELGEQPAVRVDVGNPHVVAFVDDAAALAALDLTRAPGYAPSSAFPAGVNVEFVHRIDPHRIAMRVFERGSGETRSCGTGTCAAAAATAVLSATAGRGETAEGPGAASTYRVDVPGGSVEVELGPGPDLHPGAAQSYLTGPAELVADGMCSIDDAGRLSAPGKVHARV